MKKMLNTAHLLGSTDIFLAIERKNILLLWYLLNSYIKFT